MSLDCAIDTELCRSLMEWASTKPNLRRLWVYGSRVRGDHRPDSDLDIAFVIDPLLLEEEQVAFRRHTFPAWRNELSALTGLLIHLEPCVDKVKEWAEASGVLVYERPQP